MRKLFHDLFYVPKYGKMKETAFFAHLTASVGVIVLSLIAMSFSAYAYFSCSLTASSNTIVAATFDIEVTPPDGVTLKEGTDSTYTLQPGTYQFTVQRTADSTASTGYCIVKIGDLNYITVQLGKDVNTETGSRQSVTFVLDLQDAQAANTSIDVAFTSSWGTPSVYAAMMSDADLTEAEDYYITDGETVTVDITDALPKEEQAIPEQPETDVSDPDVTESEVTEPKTTEPEVTEPVVTEPEAAEPEVTEPKVTEPEVTEPEVTEPEVTEPVATEPEAAESNVTEPEVTEPGETEASDDTAQTE